MEWTFCRVWVRKSHRAIINTTESCYRKHVSGAGTGPRLDEQKVRQRTTFRFSLYEHIQYTKRYPMHITPSVLTISPLSRESRAQCNEVPNTSTEYMPCNSRVASWFSICSIHLPTPPHIMSPTAKYRSLILSLPGYLRCFVNQADMWPCAKIPANWWELTTTHPFFFL